VMAHIFRIWKHDAACLYWISAGSAVIIGRLEENFSHRSAPLMVPATILPPPCHHATTPDTT